MAKRTGTMLREYTLENFVCLRNLGAEVTIYDRKEPAHKYLAADYMVTIDWQNGLLMLSATLDNHLSVTAMEPQDDHTFINSFSVSGYYVVKATLKAIWDSLEYAVYSGDVDMEKIYLDISQAAQQALYA